MSAKFKSQVFKVEKELSDFFSKNLDSNPVHLDGNSNELLPPGTVSGLFVIALCSKNLLYIADFKEVLAAKEIHIKWMKPIFAGQSLWVEGTYEERVHPKREKTLVRDSDCTVRCVETSEVVIKYQITQLLRMI